MDCMDYSVCQLLLVMYDRFIIFNCFFCLSLKLHIKFNFHVGNVRENNIEEKGKNTNINTLPF